MTLYSYLHDRDKVRAKSILGQMLAILGIVVITFGKIQSVTPLGVALMACTGTCWGLYSVYSGRFKGGFSYTYNSFFIFGLSVFALSPVIGALSPSSISVELSARGIGLALYMGMISTALSYVLWHRVLGRISSSQGGISQVIVPIMSSVMSVLLLGELVTSAMLIGGAVILLGIYLNT
jgi:drug/metabolite transporter (DMT)-like permease